DNSLINTTINEIKKITKETEPEVEFNKPIKKDNVIKRYGIILSLVLFIIGLVSNNDISNICYIISYIIVGYNILIKAIKNIFKGKVFDENFLMSIATIGAFIIGEFAEGAAVMIFYAIGEIFQSYAVNKSRNSISSLMDINADHANLLVNDIIKVVDPKDVAIGDIIVLKSGERVPLDGICLSDNGTLDCSALSGESIPINIERNSNVLAGSINLSNTIKLEVTKDYSNSSVARILELVENASNNKAPSVDFITRFAKIYTPIVVIAALLLALIPPLLNIGTLNEWIYRACIFLVVSCPCALVISIPLALFAGLGGASSKGILIKGGNYLEALANIDTIVFDKTGTLTKGTFSVNNVVSLDIDKDELLKIAAYGESMSTHPIAKSIVEYYNKPI
ncbi:MAG: HAD-IC family P-type ATPase, partial [Erysipelotrichaceae bacterium]